MPLIFLSSLVLTLASLSLTSSHSGSLEQVFCLLSDTMHPLLLHPLGPSARLPFSFLHPFEPGLQYFQTCATHTHIHIPRAVFGRDFDECPMLSLCFACCPDLALRYTNSLPLFFFSSFTSPFHHFPPANKVSSSLSLSFCSACLLPCPVYLIHTYVSSCHKDSSFARHL